MAVGTENVGQVSADPAILRRNREWRGLAAVREKILTSTRQEGGFTARGHTLLIAHSHRAGGVTIMDGVRSPSTAQHIKDKLIVAPAGCTVGGWYQPAESGQLFTIVELNGAAPFLDGELRARIGNIPPRLHVADERVTATALRIAALIDEPDGPGALYADTLGTLLALDLVNAPGPGAATPVARGGLAGWQARRVRDYVEDNLARDLTLIELADLVQLSPAHFCRSFARSFGTPPHRYHLTRRIERAKALLCDNSLSITDVALSVGFGGSSQFARSFRAITGMSATEYRQALR